MDQLKYRMPNHLCHLRRQCQFQKGLYTRIDWSDFDKVRLNALIHDDLCQLTWKLISTMDCDESTIVRHSEWKQQKAGCQLSSLVLMCHWVCQHHRSHCYWWWKIVLNITERQLPEQKLVPICIIANNLVFSRP